MVKIGLLDSLEAWYSANVEVMREWGVNLTFKRTDDDRPKHSAWLVAECGVKLAQLIVWDSGEAEFMAGSEDDIEIDEHHDLDDVDGLGRLLFRLTECID